MGQGSKKPGACAHCPTRVVHLILVWLPNAVLVAGPGPRLIPVGSPSLHGPLWALWLWACFLAEKGRKGCVREAAWPRVPTRSPRHFFVGIDLGTNSQPLGTPSPTSLPHPSRTGAGGGTVRMAQPAGQKAVLAWLEGTRAGKMRAPPLPRMSGLELRPAGADPLPASGSQPPSPAAPAGQRWGQPLTVLRELPAAPHAPCPTPPHAGAPVHLVHTAQHGEVSC